MLYLLQFRHSVHVRIYNEIHPGVIEPADGVLAYIVEADEPPPSSGPVVVTEYVPEPDAEDV